MTSDEALERALYHVEIMGPKGEHDNERNASLVTAYTLLATELRIREEKEARQATSSAALQALEEALELPPVEIPIEYRWLKPDGNTRDYIHCPKDEATIEVIRQYSDGTVEARLRMEK